MKTAQTCGGCGSPYWGVECQHCRTNVSEGAGSMDDLVRQASVPNLAALYRAGKKAGVLKSMKDYGGAPPA